MALVSIIVPSLNVYPYIKECLDSIVDQSLKDIEIICVDGGSTDGTREVLYEYAKKDRRIRCIDSDIKSYGYQVNIGIKIASGEYVGIIESDDYVDTRMYEKLYYEASLHNLDYVKADFDSFFDHGYRRTFYHCHIFNDSDKYNKIINGMELPEVFFTDNNIWRGIYKRDFLNKSNIELNESQGAAYQDIGFVLSVLTYAKRAMYINDSLYRYRQQREGCSSCSDKVLQFSYQEFVRLIDELHFDRTDTFKYIVQRMVVVFLSEYTKLLSKCDFAFDKNYYQTYVEKYYLWFKNKISDYMLRKYITEADMSEKDWKDLNLLMDDPEQFSFEKKIRFQKKKAFTNSIIERSKGRKVVIVSCGIWGMRAVDTFTQEGIDVVAFGDNNSNIWGTVIAGIKVQALSECVSSYKDAFFVIANKKYGEDLKQQLISLNISADNIAVLSF